MFIAEAITGSVIFLTPLHQHNVNQHLIYLSFAVIPSFVLKAYDCLVIAHDVDYSVGLQLSSNSEANNIWFPVRTFNIFLLLEGGIDSSWIPINPTLYC